MGDNKKLLNLHEQKFAELEASNTNSQIFQKTTNASLKNLETQIGQLALNLQNQMKDAFPSDTKKNPKDCMVVQLKSGKDLEERQKKMKATRERKAQRLLKHWKGKERKNSCQEKKGTRRKPRTIFLQSHFHRGCRSKR